MTRERVEYGSLRCLVCDQVPEGQQPELIVFLCHGFGAPGTDLVPFADELTSLRPEIAGRVRFVFPEAPLELDEFGMPGGRAWWLLNVDLLIKAAESGQFRDLADNRPEGIDSAAASLKAAIVAARAAAGGLPMDRVALGGFSQGAMLTTDVALQGDEAPAGLIVLSGTFLSRPDWERAAPTRAGLPVLQSHGRQDPILPFTAAERLRDLFVAANMTVDFHAFNGPHTIPYEAVQAMADFVVNRLPAE